MAAGNRSKGDSWEMLGPVMYKKCLARTLMWRQVWVKVDQCNRRPTLIYAIFLIVKLRDADAVFIRGTAPPITIITRRELLHPQCCCLVLVIHHQPTIHQALAWHSLWCQAARHGGKVHDKGHKEVPHLCVLSWVVAEPTQQNQRGKHSGTGKRFDCPFLKTCVLINLPKLKSADMS